MKKTWIIAGIAVFTVLLCGTTVLHAEQNEVAHKVEVVEEKILTESTRQKMTLKVPFDSPLFSSFPLAIVNDDKITINDINNALAASHEDMAVTEKRAEKIDFSEILNRLINVRLMIQEARNMGIDELPEVKDQVDSYKWTSMRDLLIEELGKAAKANEDDVDRLYKEVTKEWKIKSLMFKNEDEAKKMEEAIKAGKSFDEMVDKMLEEKLAEGSNESGIFKTQSLSPEINDTVSKMKINDISPIIKIGQSKKDEGYVMLRLEDVLYPDDPEAKARARAVILDNEKIETVKEYKRNLIKNNSKINREFIRKLDFESEKPGIEKLLKDKRVIAEIKGGDPLTVGDMAKGLQEKYYHGLETAIKSKKVNTKKFEILDQLLDKLLFKQEALKRGIDKSEKYINMISEFEDSLIFGLFVQKVIVPDIKVTEDEAKTYYDANSTEFSYPEMMKLDGLIFEKMADAESAMAKLRQGADFKWMKENSEGQIAKDTEGILNFKGNLLTTTSLPKWVQKALSGVTSEDFRLSKSTEDHYYVLYVQNYVPSRIQPYEETRGKIAQIVFNDKINQTLKVWSEKLREIADLDIYLADPDID